jgi:hypothetical protein
VIDRFRNARTGAAQSAVLLFRAFKPRATTSTVIPLDALLRDLNAVASGSSISEPAT